MATLNLQTISAGDSLDNTTINNNINALNAVPLTGTALNNIPTFSEDEIITAADINDAFAVIENNWIDTSDATATASDMAEGVTAYINGEKITGSVPEVPTGYRVDLSDCGYGMTGDTAPEFLYFEGQMEQDWLMRTGGAVRLSKPLSDMGNATAYDVASGKTFTSSAGLKVDGKAIIANHAKKTVNVTASKTITISSLAFKPTAIVLAHVAMDSSNLNTNLNTRTDHLITFMYFNVDRSRCAYTKMNLYRSYTFTHDYGYSNYRTIMSGTVGNNSITIESLHDLTYFDGEYTAYIF